MDVLTNKKETVVRFRTSDGTYLMACDDQKSVALVGVEAGGSTSENTKWTAKRLHHKVDQSVYFEFVSIYGKLLGRSYTEHKSGFLEVIQMDGRATRPAGSEVQGYPRWKLEERENGFPNVQIGTFYKGKDPFYLMILASEKTVVATKIPWYFDWLVSSKLKWSVEIVDTTSKKIEQSVKKIVEASVVAEAKAGASTSISASAMVVKRDKVSTAPPAMQVGRMIIKIGAYTERGHNKVNGGQHFNHSS